MRSLLCLFTFLFSITVFSQETNLALNDTSTARVLMEEVTQLSKKRQYKAALEKCLTAKSIYRKQLGEGSLEEAQCMTHLGGLYFYTRQSDKAMMVWDSSLMILKGIEGTEKDIADVYERQGRAQGMQRNFGKAIELFDRSVTIKSEQFGNQSMEVIVPMKEVAILSSYNGDFAKSIEYYKNCLTIQQAHLESSDPAIGQTYWDLGNVLSKSGENEKALTYLNKARPLLEPHLKKTDRKYAALMNSYGVVYCRQKKFDEGIPYLVQALELRKNIYGHTHGIVGSSYMNVGTAYRESEKYEEALTYLNSALEVYYSTVDSLHPLIADTYRQVGQVYVDQENFEEGLSYFDRVLGILNFSDMDNLEKTTYIPFTLPALIAKGTALQQSYLVNKSTPALKNSQAVFSTSLELLKEQYNALGEANNYLIANEGITLASEGIETEKLLLDAQLDASNGENAFEYFELTKSFTLLKSIQDANALSFAGLPDSILQKEQELRIDITKKEDYIRGYVNSGRNISNKNVVALSGQLVAVKREYAQLKDLLEKDFPRYYQLKYDLKTATVAQIQSEVLATDQSLIEYFVGQDHIYAYVINTNDYNLYKLPKDFPLEDWIKTFRESNQKDTYSPMAKAYANVAYQLYSKLVAPLQSTLKDRLIIIPDGILGYLPFEGLLVEVPRRAGRFQTHHYLVKDKQISYAYSATLLREMLQRKQEVSTTKDLLAFAPFSGEGSGEMRSRSIDEQILDAEQATLSPLPNSGEEIIGVQKIMSGDIYTAEDASKDRFVTNAANYRFLHLATHGKANDRSGDYSFLAFAPNTTTKANELLYVRDLYNLRLNADMIVLSACETGIGELQKGEGIIGLTRGFTYAGAKSIFTSLWSVEDRATKELMLQFYRHLQKGMTKDQALRQAKLDYLQNVDDPRKAHPFFWSGIIAVGDMSMLK